MKFDSTIVGVIIVLLIFIPLAYMIINASNKNKKIAKSLTELSQAKGITLKNIDVIGNLVIGIDEGTKKLVYSSAKNVTDDFRIVNLEEVKDFRIKSIKQNEKTLDWVGLELMDKQGKHEIQFYSETDESGLTKDPFVCLQDAKRWENSVRPLLKAS